MKSIQKFLERRAYKLRQKSIMSTTAAGSGHPTSCLSAADIVAVIFFHILKYDLEHPESPKNDRFIMSKGHAAPLLYAAWQEKGAFPAEELLKLRAFDSVLEGHPTSRFVYSEAATGSLGIGLSIGAGMALYNSRHNENARVFVLMGDSEVSEGSVWESMQLASYYKLHNLIGIIDINRLGQSAATIEGYNLDDYKAKCEAFGWRTFEVDGHSVGDLLKVFDEALTPCTKPTMILAKTIKGYGIASVEGKDGFHGKAFKTEELGDVLAQLERHFPEAASAIDDGVKVLPHIISISNNTMPLIKLPDPTYTLGQIESTRKAYGVALRELGERSPEIVSLDAEVNNSTFASLFKDKFPHRFVQCFIAEQSMVGMSVGFEARGSIPFASTFGAFFSRAHDQIRMAAIGRAALRLVGSHAGVSIGEDGPSQMALEDIALMSGMSDSIVLYPCDAVSTARLVACMANYHNGISYLRTTRDAFPVIYEKTEDFVIGGSKVVCSSDKDSVCIVAAGITVHEAIKAHNQLAKEGIYIRVIDCYSVKPLDVTTLKASALASQKRIITVEDHYLEGGLGQQVCYALRNEDITIECLAVMKHPRSGTRQALMHYEEIDAAAIVKAVKAYG